MKINCLSLMKKPALLSWESHNPLKNNSPSTGNWITSRIPLYKRRGPQLAFNALKSAVAPAVVLCTSVSLPTSRRPLDLIELLASPLHLASP